MAISFLLSLYLFNKIIVKIAVSSDEKFVLRI